MAPFDSTVALTTSGVDIFSETLPVAPVVALLTATSPAAAVISPVTLMFPEPMIMALPAALMVPADTEAVGAERLLATSWLPELIAPLVLESHCRTGVQTNVLT